MAATQSTTQSTPPSYEEALGLVEKLKEKPLSASALLAAHEAMAKELSDPTSKANTRLLEELKTFGDGLIRIDEAFENVKTNLGKVDANDHKDKSGQPIAKFQPTWIGFHERFTALLWSTRDTAIGTEAYIRDFLENVIKEIENIETEDAYNDAVKDLREFISRKGVPGQKLNTEETAEQAEKHSQAFTALRRDVHDFKLTFDDFAKHHIGELGDDIKKLDNEIIKINAEIEKARLIVLAMGLAMGVTIFATGAVAPVAATIVVIVGIAAAIAELTTLIVYFVKGNELRSERDAKKAERAELQAQLDTLYSLKATLQSQKADIDDICSRLDQLAGIWSQVNHDARLILDDLSTAIKAADNGASKKSFKGRVNLIRSGYTALLPALEQYSTMVKTSH